MNADLRCIGMLLAATLGLAAQTVDPFAYAMPNGELGPGGLRYRDDLYKGGNGDARQDRSALSGGLGQLVDNLIGCSRDPAKDCGSGPGYDWVGWHGDDPPSRLPLGTAAISRRSGFMR